MTGYLYFSYAADRLVVWNNSPDRWMPLRGVGIKNYAIPAVRLTWRWTIRRSMAATPTRWRTWAASRRGSVSCSWPPTRRCAPPEDCNVVARLAIGPDLIFWAADFGVIRPVDEQEHTCPAASPDGLRLCILPG